MVVSPHNVACSFGFPPKHLIDNPSPSPLDSVRLWSTTRYYGACICWRNGPKSPLLRESEIVLIKPACPIAPPCVRPKVSRVGQKCGLYKEGAKINFLILMLAHSQRVRKHPPVWGTHHPAQKGRNTSSRNENPSGFGVPPKNGQNCSGVKFGPQKRVAYNKCSLEQRCKWWVPVNCVFPAKLTVVCPKEKHVCGPLGWKKKCPPPNAVERHLCCSQRNSLGCWGKVKLAKPVIR